MRFYYWVIVAYPTIFPQFYELRVRVCHDATAYCNASVYTVSLRMRGASMLVFKFFKIIYRYSKRSGTWNIFFLFV